MLMTLASMPFVLELPVTPMTSHSLETLRSSVEPLVQGYSIYLQLIHGVSVRRRQEEFRFYYTIIQVQRCSSPDSSTAHTFVVP